jgi:hypothetical protein
MIEFYLLCYNNNFCVEYQIKTIKFFCKDPFKIIIIDSNCGKHNENSIEKENICKQWGVEYLTLPNELSLDNLQPSRILGKKLNWIYYNIVLKRNPIYFSFLDQDFFMIKPFTIIEFLDKYGMWGDIMELYDKTSDSFIKEKMNNSPWILHPWLSFYKLDFIREYKMNWEPSPGTDTGGSNWEPFIKILSNKHENKINKSDYWFRDNIIMYYPFAKYSNSGPKPYEKHYCKHNNQTFYGQIQFNNGFMHLLNSHILTDPFHPKTAMAKGILDGILLANGYEFTKENGYEIFDSPCNKVYKIT